MDNYVVRGFYSGRSADVFAIQKPYWLFGKEGTSHGRAASDRNAHRQHWPHFA
jgi:hypothetical protein